MSLFLDSISPSTAIRLPNLSEQQMALGYVVDNTFILSTSTAFNGFTDNTISESNNNGISWSQTTVPISLGTIWGIGSLKQFRSQRILIKTRKSNNLYNLYDLSDIKRGSPYPSPIYSSNQDYNIINNSEIVTLTTSGASGYGSYIIETNTSIGGNQVFKTYAIPYAGYIPERITKNYFPDGGRLYYTKNNLWADPGIINLYGINGLTVLSSPVFENAESELGTSRGVAFAFANNFTKLLKIQKSSIPYEPVIEVFDSNPPIGYATDIKASITSDGKIWVCYLDFSVNQTRRLFSPNFGGEWIQLSDLPQFIGSFYTSLSGLNQIVTTSYNGSYISTNYGY